MKYRYFIIHLVQLQILMQTRCIEVASLFRISIQKTTNLHISHFQPKTGGLAQVQIQGGKSENSSLVFQPNGQVSPLGKIAGSASQLTKYFGSLYNSAGRITSQIF